MNINRLIGIVQEHFDNVQNYYAESKKKPYWKRTNAEDTHIGYLSTLVDANTRELSNFCEVLDLDSEKLYAIARLTRKWEKAHKWRLCFPMETYQEAIGEYIKKRH